MRTLIIGGKFTTKTRRASLKKAVEMANAVAYKYGSDKKFDLHIVGKVELQTINRTKTERTRTINNDARKASIARLAVIRAIYNLAHDVNSGIIPSLRDIYRCGIHGYKNATRILSELISLVKDRFGRIKNLFNTKIANLWQSISTYINKDTFMSLLDRGMTIHMA